MTNATRALEIREHPLLGPYVPDLKYIQVKTKEDFQNVLNLGNQQRSVASTNANQRSSRSHAIVELEAQAVRLNFVDLAGSEKSQQFHGSKGKNDRFAVSVSFSFQQHFHFGF
jgi:hypothetical protein